jgi:hypothetical protein
VSCCDRPGTRKLTKSQKVKMYAFLIKIIAIENLRHKNRGCLVCKGLVGPTPHPQPKKMAVTRTYNRLTRNFLVGFLKKFIFILKIKFHSF